MKFKEVEVNQVRRDSNYTPWLTLECGHVIEGTSHFDFRPGSKIKCVRKHDNAGLKDSNNEIQNHA